MAKRRVKTKHQRRVAAAKKAWRTRRAAAKFRSDISAASRRNPRKKRKAGKRRTGHSTKSRTATGRFKKGHGRIGKKRSRSKRRSNPFDGKGFWHRPSNGEYGHLPHRGGVQAKKRSQFAKKVARGRSRSARGTFKNPRQLPAPRRRRSSRRR
jgi:hypothetical protein